jgi:TonB-linked SusC/RagA family outer membrane protein
VAGLHAQESQITGTITDSETNAPVSGATVTIASLRIGAISDRFGKYTIHHVPPGKHEVEARLIGYQRQVKEASVTEGMTVTLDFSIKPTALQQNEIVVVGLSGETDRKKLGNTIGSVEGTEIARAVTPNAIDAISGRVTGVNVTRTNGVPGAGTYITIRGRKTISGSSEPLYVIDGTIIDNSSVKGELFQGGDVQLANRAVDINPADIESMQVLKGAAAAAIYGSRAANGVILITTKRGRPTGDKPARVVLTTSYQLDNKVGNVPLQRVYGQAIPYQPGAPGEPGTPGSTNSWGKKLPDDTTTYAQDEVPFRTGDSYETTLSVNGVAGSFNYLISGTRTDLNGFVIGSELARNNFRLNLGTEVLPKLYLQSNSNYISLNNDLPQNGSNLSGILLGALRTPPEFNTADYLEPDGTQHRFGFYDNPIWTQHNNTFNTTLDRFIHSSKADWTPLEWLNITGLIGIDRYDQINTERLAVGSAASDNRAGKIFHDRITSSTVNTDLTFNINHSFSDDFDLNVTLGGQTIWESSTEDEATSKSTLGFFDEISAGAAKDATSSTAEAKTVGLFAQATATISDRLSVTGAIRRDGSSTFGTSDQFHYYPKGSVAYTISDEPFMESTRDIISNLRLRGSYGWAGSPSLPGAYATNVLYNTLGFPDPWGRETSAGRVGFIGIKQGPGGSSEYVTIGNDNIRPELSKELEVGLDLGVLENRVTLEATFYHADIEDLILWVPVPGSSGYDQQLRNAGKMWNEGYEIGLNVEPIHTEDFTWNSTINYSRNYNLVTELNIKPSGSQLTGNEFVQIEGGFTGITNVAVVGRPLGVMRGLGWLRDINGNIVYSGDVYTAKDGTVHTAEDSFNNPFKGAPVVDPNLQIVGKTDPDFTFSWNNEFTLLTDISFGFLVDASIGQDVWNGTRGALYNFGTHGDTKDREDPWINDRGEQVLDISDPNNPTPVTREEYYREYANTFVGGADEAHVEKGSYVKLREVHAEYRWHGLQEWGIEEVALNVSARNLLTISDYTGYDPEVNNFQQAEGRGFDYFTLPQTRSLRFSLSLTY